MNRLIDLRSDTVTVPTARMRDAMRDSIVGDDVLGEDVTVQRLEAMAADMFRMEAALFLVSGTMANQVAVGTLCNHGDQIIVHRRSHIYNLEVAGLSTLCGVQPRAIDVSDGWYDLDQLDREVHDSGLQTAPTTLICLENSFDLNRGLAVPADCISNVSEYARQKGMNVYLDGARIFNAAIALGVSVASICDSVDMVAFCLSKGLGCPIGSLLLGSQANIQKARRLRQRLGGGWRQAGILAAAGIVALNEMVDRLLEDHIHAKLLAEGLVALGFHIDLEHVHTNIIHVELSNHDIEAVDFCSRLAQQGVRAKTIGRYEVRMVTHKDIQRVDIEAVLEAAENSLGHVNVSARGKFSEPSF